MMNASEILRQAAAKVEQGWTQGAYVDDHGVCAIGALCHVMYGKAGLFYETGRRAKSRSFLEVTDVLEKVMREQFADTYEPQPPEASWIIYVNDELAHDKSEIIACMEKAAARLEEQG